MPSEEEGGPRGPCSCVIFTIPSCFSLAKNIKRQRGLFRTKNVSEAWRVLYDETTSDATHIAAMGSNLPHLKETPTTEHMLGTLVFRAGDLFVMRALYTLHSTVPLERQTSLLVFMPRCATRAILQHSDLKGEEIPCKT